MLPAGYPIPIDGPVGAFIRAQGRHNMRPAHLHFLTYKPGFKTLVSQEYADIIYNGLWFSAFHQDLFAFVASSQRWSF